MKGNMTNDKLSEIRKNSNSQDQMQTSVTTMKLLFYQQFALDLFGSAIIVFLVWSYSIYFGIHITWEDLIFNPYQAYLVKEQIEAKLPSVGKCRLPYGSISGRTHTRAFVCNINFHVFYTTCAEIAAVFYALGSVIVVFHYFTFFFKLCSCLRRNWISNGVFLEEKTVLKLTKSVNINELAVIQLIGKVIGPTLYTNFIKNYKLEKSEEDAETGAGAPGPKEEDTSDAGINHESDQKWRQSFKKLFKKSKKDANAGEAPGLEEENTSDADFNHENEQKGSQSFKLKLLKKFKKSKKQ